MDENFHVTGPCPDCGGSGLSTDLEFSCPTCTNKVATPFFDEVIELVESLLDPLARPCRLNINTNRCLEHLLWGWPCPQDRARAWLEANR